MHTHTQAYKDVLTAASPRCAKMQMYGLLDKHMY